MNRLAAFGARLLEPRAVIVGMTLLAGAGWSAPASSQGTDDNSPLEEIVVTSRFKEENIQNVGQSISALSGSQLEAAGYTDFADIARRTPSLNATYRGPNASTPSIRGLATLSPILDTVTTPQLVGIYYDDIPITAPFASQRDVSFVDLQRIEVLRGPQGTLYGEGSMGGAIRYLSADPDMQHVTGQVNLTGQRHRLGLDRPQHQCLRRRTGDRRQARGARFRVGTGTTRASSTSPAPARTTRTAINPAAAASSCWRIPPTGSPFASPHFGTKGRSAAIGPSPETRSA